MAYPTVKSKNRTVKRTVKRVERSGERQQDYLTLAKTCPHGIVESRDWDNLQH